MTELKRTIDADIQQYVFDVTADKIWSYDERSDGLLVADEVYDDIPHWTGRDFGALTHKLKEAGIALSFVTATSHSPGRITAQQGDHSVECVLDEIPALDIGACIAVLRLVGAPGYS